MAIAVSILKDKFTCMALDLFDRFAWAISTVAVAQATASATFPGMVPIIGKPFAIYTEFSTGLKFLIIKLN
jgi:hypothetical protein